LSHDADWTQWNSLLERVHSPAYEVTVALVGKHVDLPDAYLSVSEALRAGGFHHRARVAIRWVEAGVCGSAEGVGGDLEGHAGVATMAEQEGVVAEGGDRDGAMRLGAHDHVLVEGSLAARVYGATAISERHRHRYEVSNGYRDRLEQAGLRISGVTGLGQGRS